MHYFTYKPGELDRIHEFYGKSPESIVEHVEAIKRWFKTQPYLPETPCDHKIQLFLQMHDWHLERTQEKFKMYYVVRSLVPEVFTVMDVKTAAMATSMSTVYFLPLPQLTFDLCRVTICRVNVADVSQFGAALFFAQTLNVAELRTFEDAFVGNRMVFDLGRCTLGHLRAISSPHLLRKAFTILKKAYTLKTIGIHFVNNPSFIDRLVTILKTVLRPKLISRIHIHSTLDSLYEFIPKEILPVEYGGDEVSLSVLNDKLQQAYRIYEKELGNVVELRVDDSLLLPQQQRNSLFDDQFGYVGSFTKLEVD